MGKQKGQKEEEMEVMSRMEIEGSRKRRKWKSSRGWRLTGLERGGHGISGVFALGDRRSNAAHTLS